MLEFDEYAALHPMPMQPTDIVIDVDDFEETMKKYHYAFRSWGRKKQHMPRYGLPLVNENGSMYNNPEIICYPLDEWNRPTGDLIDNPVYDRDFTTPTPVLAESCFNPLNDLKQYMLRSCILRWDAETFFHPHVDTWFPSPILRLWGTNNPEVSRIQFDKNFRRCDMPAMVPSMNPEVVDYPPEQIEAGRLYVIDTSVMHAARTINDTMGYQFFIALHTDGQKELFNHVL
tara:strand:+ start:1790 stop:2479 length:690 start_codon:yes stop_codon:yes gene_type:complete